MFHHIKEEFEHGRPVCYGAILGLRYAEFHLLVLPDTLRHIVPGEADHAQELYLSDDELDNRLADPEETEKIDRGTTKPLHESPLSH
jgi:hypothetical protein